MDEVKIGEEVMLKQISENHGPDIVPLPYVQSSLLCELTEWCVYLDRIVTNQPLIQIPIHAVTKEPRYK